ncbi:MAG: hypothetical protein U0U69_05505 [Acidimicrobiia bacterium]
MTAPTSEPTEEAQQPDQSDPVVGVNDWGRVSDAWERVFDDVSAVGSDLKTVFKGAYRAAAVDPSIDLSDAVGSLGAEQFVGVSERLDRGLAGARAALTTLGDELHEGGSERLHGEVEGAVKVSLYELGMLLIRMSDKLDGEVPPPRVSRVAPATPPVFEDGWDDAAVAAESQPETAIEAAVAYEATWPDAAPASEFETAWPEAAAPPTEAAAPVTNDSTEEIPEIDLSETPPQAGDPAASGPGPIPVRPASEEAAYPPDVIRPD